MDEVRVPVVVLAGFLGAGKTTVLNHLLHNRGGARIGAVVNDFGSVPVDAMMIDGQVDAMVSLGNGCLCCAVDSAGLDALLERLSGHDLDLVVIEASGLAEPRDLVRQVLATDRPGLEYGGLVVVVDAVAFEATRVAHPQLDAHLRCADLVVLTKTDRVPPEATERLLALLTGLTQAAVLPAVHGAIDPHLLFDPRERVAPAAGGVQLSLADLMAELGVTDSHPHSSYRSVDLVGGAVHPRRFMDLLAEWAPGVYRFKGWVNFGVPGHEERYLLHAVGGHVRFTVSPWPEGSPRRTELVALGTFSDVAGLRSAFGATIEPDPCAVDPAAMMRVLARVGDLRQEPDPGL